MLTSSLYRATNTGAHVRLHSYGKIFSQPDWLLSPTSVVVVRQYEEATNGQVGLVRLLADGSSLGRTLPPLPPNQTVTGAVLNRGDYIRCYERTKIV